MPIKDQTCSWSSFIINIRQLSVISAGFPCSHLDELHITWSRKQICRAKREWVRYFPLLANKSHQKIKKIGSEDLPHLYAITPGEREGTFHFHFQYGSRNKRYTFVKRNTYSGSVQLCCFHQNGKVKCTARIRVAVKNALIIKNVGKRVSKEKKKKKNQANL